MDFRKRTNRGSNKLAVRTREVSGAQLVETLTLFGRGVSKRRADATRAWKPRRSKIKVDVRRCHYQGLGANGLPIWS